MHPSLGVLQEALDQRLEGAARLGVDQHLTGCEMCRRRLHALRWTKVRLAGVGTSLALPPSLEAEIRRVLAADRPPAGPPAPVPRRQIEAGWRRWFDWWRREG